MAKEKVEQSPAVTMLLVITDVLFLFSHIAGRKPSDPDVLAAMGRLDNQRKELQRQLGQEATELDTPHGQLHTYAIPEADEE